VLRCCARSGAELAENGIVDAELRQWFAVLEYAPLGCVLDAPDVAAHPMWRLAVLESVARALQFLASKHTVHRDVSLRNVLVFRAGRELRVKLCDFALAAHLPTDDDDAVLVDTSVAVSVREAAPELVAYSEASLRSDVFSFGVLAWQLWSGVPPFLGADNGEVREMLVDNAYADELARPEAMDAPLWRCVVAPCLSFLPRERPLAVQLVADLCDYGPEDGGGRRAGTAQDHGDPGSIGEASHGRSARMTDGASGPAGAEQGSYMSHASQKLHAADHDSRVRTPRPDSIASFSDDDDGAAQQGTYQGRHVVAGAPRPVISRDLFDDDATSSSSSDGSSGVAKQGPYLDDRSDDDSLSTHGSTSGCSSSTSSSSAETAATPASWSASASVSSNPRGDIGALPGGYVEGGDFLLPTD
jgi:serine/threonine protein kinase